MNEQKIDQGKLLLEVWQIVARYRWRFLAIAFLATAAVLAASLLLPRKYQAEAVFERSVDMVLSEIASRGGSRPVQSPRASLNKEIAGELAVNQLLNELEPTLREKGYVHTRHDLDDLRRHLIRHVRTHWDVSSPTHDRIRLNYVTHDPKLAEMLLNGLIENYIDTTRTAMNRRLTQSADFFRDKVRQSQVHIDNLENQLLQFEIDNASMLPDASASAQLRAAELENDLIQLIGERDAAAIRAKALAAALAATPPQREHVVTAPNPELRELRDQLRKLRERENHAVNTLKMTDRHPDLANLRTQIQALGEQAEQLDEQVVTERKMLDNSRHSDLALQLTNAQSEYDSLASRVESMRGQLAKMNSSPIDLFTTRSKHQALGRQVNEAQRQAAFWEDNLRRIEVALAAEHGGHAVQLNFAQPASASRRPVSPNLIQVLMAAVALGAIAGALAVFLAYRTDETFNDAQEVAETCNLPLIGSVSELITQRHRRIRRVRNFVLYPTNALAMGAVVIALAVALYLDLERPGKLGEIRQSITANLFSPASAAASTSSDEQTDTPYADHEPEPEPEPEPDTATVPQAE